MTHALHHLATEHNFTTPHNLTLSVNLATWAVLSAMSINQDLTFGNV
jgi:hypothetical protein